LPPLLINNGLEKEKNDNGEGVERERRTKSWAGLARSPKRLTTSFRYQCNVVFALTYDAVGWIFERR
jgi:hypothetical protein